MKEMCIQTKTKSKRLMQKRVQLTGQGRGVKGLSIIIRQRLYVHLYNWLVKFYKHTVKRECETDNGTTHKIALF